MYDIIATLDICNPETVVLASGGALGICSWRHNACDLLFLARCSFWHFGILTIFRTSQQTVYRELCRVLHMYAQFSKYTILQNPQSTSEQHLHRQISMLKIVPFCVDSRHDVDQMANISIVALFAKCTTCVNLMHAVDKGIRGGI